MNELIAANVITMSTVEIAQLTGKRHDNVMRKAKELVDKGIILAPQIEEPYTSGKGRVDNRIIYNLNKTESLNLVANLSPEFTAQIINRWQELENTKPALPNFNNPVAAARAWANEKEQNQRLEQKVETLQPKGDFYDAVVSSDSLIDMSEVAKVLAIKGLGRNKLFNSLREMKVLQNNNEPYQAYIDRGWFKLVERKWKKPDGTVKITLKTMVYQKGLDGIRKLIEKQTEAV